jgi:hypothetical protein
MEAHLYQCRWAQVSQRPETEFFQKTRFLLLTGMGIHPEPAMCMAGSKPQEKMGNDMTQTTNPT